MNTLNTYAKFRHAGYPAQQALRYAKTLRTWEQADYKGLVKIEAKAEYENYFDVYGEPNGYTDQHGRYHSAEDERKEIEQEIEQKGCWYVVTYYRMDEGDEWQQADSIGMCIYNDPCSPFENAYAADLMQSALAAIEAQSLAPAI